MLNHVYPGDDSVSDSVFHAAVERDFKRRVVFSRDLMVLDVAELAR